MEYLILDWPEDHPGTRATLDRIEPAGTWARFGSTLFILGPGKSDPGEAAGDRGKVRKGHPHLVIQKGRSFQQEHPEVPVLLDKGRFLVVDLPPARARAMAGEDEHCYHVEPLGANRVVFRSLPRPTRATAPAPELASVVGAISQRVFESVLAHLVAIPSRLSTGPGYAQAAAWMRDEFAALGLATRLEPISVNGRPSTNVIAHRRGSGPTPQHVLVVAHLDSVNHQGGDAAPAPGADDNGSGSAGVLVLARALAGATLEHDVSFILFGGEEQGLFGSKQFVAALPETERERICAVLNMDMIGVLNSPPPSVLLEGAALSQPMIDALSDAAAAFTGLAVEVSLNPFASDHVPFIEAGIPSVLTIEGGDSANDAIHTANDTMDRIDSAFTCDILRMNAGYLAVAAGITAGVVQPVPDPHPAVPMPCGCCGPAVTPQNVALHQLAAHYQALLAQYGRLQQQGAMEPKDIAGGQAVWAAYESLRAQSGGF